MKNVGLPANVNPFSVIVDYCLCDGLVAGEFPNYFRDNAFPQALRGCFCRARKVKCEALSQKEAELLVETVVKTDPIMAIGVKEAYKHIVPAHLMKEVLIVRTKNGQCTESEIVNKDILNGFS